MKKAFAVFMCMTLLTATLFSVRAIPASAALEDGGMTAEMDVLCQLGVLNAKASTASVTKSVMAEGINKIFNSDGYADKYFEGQNLSKPLLGGQAAMILVDILGYSPEVKVNGGKDADAYIRKARQLKIVGSGGLKAAEELTAERYAEMLYIAIVKTPLMRQELYGEVENYKVDRNATLLSEQMEIRVIEGIVQSVGKFTLMSADEGNAGHMTVGGNSYKIDETHNNYEYLGCLAEVYVNDDNKVCAFAASADNERLKLASEDISAATMNSVTYYSGNKKKTAKLSPTVDIMYNRELMTSYTPNDFTCADCNYIFIDNNSDGNYEVVMIEYYASAVINQISYNDKTVSLTGGGLIELDEYFEDGRKMYDQKGLELNADMIARSQVLSYMVGKSGKITNIIICSQKETGTVDSFRNDKEYITINGTEYQCTKEYLNNAGQKEVCLGDYVTASFNFLGYIVDIDVGKTGGHTAYFIDIADGDFSGGCRIKLLDEDGEIKVFKTTEKIALNDGRASSSDLLTDKRLTAEGGAKRQLIRYRKNSRNEISAIELADDKAYIGSRANEGFTIDYDFEKNGVLRALSVNGRKLLGAKYVCNEDTIVFHYCTSDETLSYVQNGSSIGTNSNQNLKLYNVNKDYDIQYAVREFTRSFGGWVDYYGDTYMVDYVSRVWNDEANEIEYELNLYDPKGNKKALRTTDGTIVPSIYNIFSGDERLAEVPLKDLKRGSVIQVASDWRGVTGYSLQNMPMADNSEFIFEKITGSGDNYGLTTTMFNGSYLMCYGVVVTRAKYGIIINNHLPTEEETGDGAVFPMEEWNRYIPLEATDKVIVYDKARDVVTPDVAACIREGDHVFIKRSGTAYNGVYVFR